VESNVQYTTGTVGFLETGLLKLVLEELLALGLDYYEDFFYG
jgi:hypothetical protein